MPEDRRDDGTIMMSMGALGHYMHELSAAGFAIRDFLHEGNGPIWDSAFTRGPAPLVEWVLVEEVAEGGDAIIQRHRQFPMLKDYERICSGGGIALYRRIDRRGSDDGSRPTVRQRFFTMVREPPSNHRRTSLRTSVKTSVRTESRTSPGSGIRRDRSWARGNRSRRDRPPPSDTALRRRWSHVADQEPRAEHRDRTDRRAAVHIAFAEDGPAGQGEIDEVAGLAVAPVVDANAAADIRLNGALAAERQHANRARDRHDCGASALLDLAVVRP